MATALELLQIHGLDFAMFTPFTGDEAQAVLGLSPSGYLQARREGALTCSVTLHSDPLGRLRFHSLWDLVECTARIDAGWPLVPLHLIEEQIMDASENICLSLFDEEPGPAASRRAPCRSFPSPAFFWQVHQSSEPCDPRCDGRSKDQLSEAIARTTLNAFWKTLAHVNRLLPDPMKVWREDQLDTQLSLKL